MKEVTALSLVVLSTFFCAFQCIAQDSYMDAARSTSMGKGHGKLAEMSGDSLARFADPIAEKSEGLERISSVLGGLGKNLILESTRGAKDTQVYQKASPFVVLIGTDKALGSGALIDPEGHVITNCHVVENSPNVTIYFKPKDNVALKGAHAYQARVEKTDQTADLALLKIVAPPNANGFLEFGTLSKIEVGQDVHAIGHPSGQTWSYTKGIVSQIRKGYKWSGEDGLNHLADVIQTQTPINPGNSGGPLLNDDGKLIGINSFRMQGEGLNYAIAVDTIQEFLARKENRVASRNKPKNDMNCPESYDTQRKGQADIVGCYNGHPTPPPHYWLVSRDNADYPVCIALDSGRKNKIDTVATINEKDGSIIWFFDRGCTGIVNLIGFQAANSDDIDSYQRPEETIRLVSLAQVLDSAIKNRKLPYPGLQFCK